MLACPCGGRMKYVASMFDRKGLQRLLRAKNPPTTSSPSDPPEAPPQAELDLGA